GGKTPHYPQAVPAFPPPGGRPPPHRGPPPPAGPHVAPPGAAPPPGPRPGGGRPAQRVAPPHRGPQQPRLAPAAPPRAQRARAERGTSEGGMSRMAVSWDTFVPGGEAGRVYGQRGYMLGMTYTGQETKLPDLERPALPPRVEPGGHGGSHGHLTDEFVTAILED